ncbi:hypothetical protein TNCV_2410321 [Trichonephila clavipes]|nr:hypothetical protein TNCV_2410321 [Trichonephila clavipes]
MNQPRTWGRKSRRGGIIRKNSREGGDVKWKKDVKNTLIRRKVCSRCEQYTSRLDVRSATKRDYDRNCFKLQTCSYSRAFGDGRRNFDPWAIDDDTPSPNFHTTPWAGCLSLNVFNVHCPYTAGLERY